jgi:hypothetical protein
MCNDRASFQSFKRLPTPCEIRLGDGHVVHAFYHGLVELHVDLIVDALYVPEFHLSLLSVRNLDRSGIDTRINNNAAHFFHSTSHTTPFLEAPAIEDNLYTLQLTPRPDVPLVNHDTMTSVQIATTRSQAAAQKQAAEPEPPVHGYNTPTLPVLGKRARTPEPTEALPRPVPLRASSELQTPPQTTADAVHVPPRATSCPKLWHRRFAHLHPDALRTLLGSAAADRDDHASRCTVCIRTKHRRRISRQPQRRATRPFELVHSDLCGPMRTDSHGGKRYYIVFIDDFSRWTFVYFLHTKDREACANAFREMQSYVKTQYGCTIRRFRCDNGRGEYDNTLFRSILTTRGIRFEPAPAFTQHKNGVSERMLQTLNSKARACILDAQLPTIFWAELIETACYLHRRSPTRSLQGRTPYEVLHSWLSARDQPQTLRPHDVHQFRPPLVHLRRVGCVAWKVIPKEQRCDKNFGPRSRCCMMLGYVHDFTHIWRLWDFETNTGHLHGRPFQWSDVEWEEDVNAFPSVGPKAAGRTEPEELVFPDEYYDDSLPSQSASLDLPGAAQQRLQTPCHRDNVSPHVEMSPTVPTPCRRDSVSPYVEKPPAPAPCHRNTVSPHVEMPPAPAPCHRDAPSLLVEIPSVPPPSPCHRDAPSPHVDQCVAYALLISCNLQLLLTLLPVCRVATPCRVAKP